MRAGQRQGEAAVVAGSGHHGGAAQCEGAAQHASWQFRRLRLEPLRTDVKASVWNSMCLWRQAVRRCCIQGLITAHTGSTCCGGALVSALWLAGASRAARGFAAVGRRGGLGRREGLPQGGRDPAGQVPAVLHGCAALRAPAARAHPLLPTRSPATAGSMCTLRQEPSSV